MRRRTIFILAVALAALWVLACSESIRKPQTRDPLEALTYDYLNKVKMKKWDDSYNMMSADTRKYFDKKAFVEWATTFIAPKVDYVYVTRIEKRKLDATVYTKFMKKTKWESYNSLEEAKIKLSFVYKDGKWWVHRGDIVEEGREKEEKEKARLARVAEWKPHLKFHDFKVESKITADGPLLVFDGEIENTSDKIVEMVMVMVDFFDAKGVKVFDIVVVPIYISKWEKDKGALGPKSKTTFQSSISSEIPDTWAGKIDYYVYDAGDMPAKR